MTMGTEIVQSNGSASGLALQPPQHMATHETAQTAVAAQARAMVEARYVMALQRPRDTDAVRQGLLRDCARPGFADVARYHKPIGKGIEGPSIRFAEAAIRHMGNIDVQTPTVYDDASKRIVRVSVCDLETNANYSVDISVEKTVERSQLKEGQVSLGVRQNSYGKATYLVAATEDDLLNKQNALISKAIRTCALRVLPGDILEECMEKVKETQKNAAAVDPDGARKKLIDAFGALGVKAQALRAYVGHELDALTPAEIADLRTIYSSIKDGETTWHAVLEAKGATEDGPTKPAEGGRASQAKAAAKAKAAEAKAAHPNDVIDTETGEVTVREPGEEG